MVVAFLLVTGTAYAQGYERIESFDVSLEITQEGLVHVREEIVYNFGSNERRGIFREIPKTQTDGTVRRTSYSEITVTDEHGVKQPTHVEQGGSLVSIRVGDPDIYIRGSHTYVISYTVQNALGYFDDLDELYWNSTGDEWEVPIDRTSTKIIVPGAFSQSALHIASYCGPFGSQNTCGTETVTTKATTTEISFEGPQLGSYEGMTVAVGFPKGTVLEPVIHWWERPAMYNLLGLVIFFIFFGYFVKFLISVIRVYRSNQKPIIAQYEPPHKFSPAQVARIFNEGKSRAILSSGKVIGAEVIYLASLGLLHIERIPGEQKKYIFNKKTLRFLPLLVVLAGIILFIFKLWGAGVVAFVVAIILKALLKPKKNDILSLYQLRRTQKSPEKLDVAHEQLLEHIVPDANPRTLKELYQEKDYSFYDGILEQLLFVDEVYLTKNYFFPEKSCKNYGKWIIGIFFSFWVLPFFLVFMWNLFERASSSLIGLYSVRVLAVAFGCFVIFGILQFFLKTFLGRIRSDTWYEVAGFYQYIKTAEQHRIEFENDPVRARQIYSKLLPFAIMLGLEQTWTKAFTELIPEGPDWYDGSDIHEFSTNLTPSLAGAFGSIANAGRPASSGSSSSSGGSSGGGSSGGGGGGGGGGSW